MFRSVIFISVVFVFSLSAYSQVKSIYTNLAEKKCRTIELTSEGTGWYRGLCPGLAGYKLEVIEGDLRQSINVIDPNKKKYELDLMNVSGGFSSVGPRAEWRMNGKIPTALIFRFDAYEDPDDPRKITSYLVVAKITKSQICVTDAVAPGRLQNTEARRFANQAMSKPCKFSN